MGNSTSGQGEKKGGVEGGLRVLPREGGGRPRLRPTRNGAILYTGGTIRQPSPVKSDRSETRYQGKSNPMERHFYGSEPDLRITGQREQHSSESKFKLSRSRKKYKAPPAPQNIQAESSSPDSYQHWEKNKCSEWQPPRRLRLFRTRAETKRRLAEENLSSLPPLGTLHRSLSTPQIQLDSSGLTERGGKFEYTRTDDFSKQRTDTRNGLDFDRERNRKEIYKHKSDGSGRSFKGGSPGTDEENKTWQRTSPPRASGPVKTFYFGMDSDGDGNDAALIEKFAEKLQHVSLGNTPHALVSTSSSESLADLTLDEEGRGINVQLRATLPRKQVDIPRFSPTTAWRLLSALDSPAASEDDDLVPMEERIPAPPLPLHIPSHMDKSADSGISGDASPHHHDSTHNSQAAWTPQQDLEETSSEGGLDSLPVSPESLTTAKFSPRFSLSLPRDNRLKLYTQTEKVEISQPTSLHSLKKLKRSMSGVLGKGNFLREENMNISEAQHLFDGNWVLSRSVPNSLNITHISLPKWCEIDSPVMNQDNEIQGSSLTTFPSFLHLANGGHIMYLPSYTTPREKSVGALAMSKSCEDLTCEKAKISESVMRSEDMKKGNNRKFTFQSTIRQLERKRIAEKLSKQAEYRERERHSEMEAMRRVEEEFQRKREREKADIRQQLRLYSMKQTESMQTDVVDSPPQATQILSEYRQQIRDYRDYRLQRGLSMEPDIVPSVCDTSKKKEMVHPEVIYKIPKSTQVYITSRQNNSQSLGTDFSGASDNYRKDFAQGALPHSLASSDSEVSQPNSRLLQGRYTPQEESSYYNNTNELSLISSEIEIEDNKKKKENNSQLLNPQIINADLVLPMHGCENKVNKVKESSSPNLRYVNMNLKFIQPFARGKAYRPVPYNPSNNPIAQFAT